PSKYIMAMPSKGLRSSFTSAVNQWNKLDKDIIQSISDIINILHNSSLILDDIEDNSPLRRGLPATHVVFGPGQAINTATFMFVQAVKLTRKLPHPSSADVVLEELTQIFVGQSLWE
ncbi:isoprenoid synthase domain-containing protein, partial [Diaporthe sp. PMI_573]